MIIKSKSAQGTIQIAKKLASFLHGGEIILLNGDLGSGKTTFVKGIAQFFNIKQSITSPTFTLMKTYPLVNGLLVHIDAYRLELAYFEEMEDYLNENNIIFIEWSNYLKSQDLFQDNLSITITRISKNQRKIILEAHGDRYEKIIEGMMKSV